MVGIDLFYSWMENERFCRYFFFHFIAWAPPSILWWYSYLYCRTQNDCIDQTLNWGQNIKAHAYVCLGNRKVDSLQDKIQVKAWLMSRLKSTSLPAKKANTLLSMHKSLEVVPALEPKLFIQPLQIPDCILSDVNWCKRDSPGTRTLDSRISRAQSPIYKSGLVLFFGFLTCCQYVPFLKTV